MNPIVPALPAALAGLVILLAPGLLLLALLPAREREALPLDESLYLAVGVSVASAAWLGLVLAELGRFSLLTAAACVAVGAGAIGLACRRRLTWPLRRPPRWGALAPAALVLTLAFVLQARPSQYLVGGRDPGAYIAAMGMIARNGGLVYTDPAVLSIPPEDIELFYRHPDRPDFSWSRFMGFDLERPQTGRVFPQFFHLFPAFGAYLFQAMGAKGALATAPLFGILGTLGVFFTLRRLFGAGAALLAALLLGLNVVQVWFARFPVSETVSQFLIFLALFAFSHWEERGSRVFGALAGAALGLTLLVRIDSVLIGVPLGLYVLVRRARRELRWAETLALLVPFTLLLLHAGLHAAVWSRKYVLSIMNRNYWGPVTWTLAALALLGLLVAAEWLGPRVWRALEARPRTLRVLATTGVVVLALYAYFVRPQLSALAGAPGNGATRSLTNFTALDTDRDGRIDYAEFVRRPAGGTPELFDYYDENGDGKLSRIDWSGDPPLWLARLGFNRLAAHDAQAFYRLGWFVGPLGLLVGVLGLLLAFRQWRPRYLFPTLVALTFALFYFYKIRVWHDYYFALRRFVPVVIPFLLGFAALLLVRLGARTAGRRALAALIALALGVGYVRDTKAIAWFTDWNNAVRFVADVSRRFTPADVVIFEQPRSIHLLSLPLWAVHGAHVLELARFDPDPERLQHLIRAWRGRYRNIYFVHTYRTDLCGVFLQRVEDHGFGTQEWERTYDRPPRRPEARALSFRVSRVVPPEELRVPALPELDVGSTDDFQVSGFFGKEGGGAHSFRWTGACASVYLPGARPGATLAITAAVGERPASSRATVTASLSGAALGSFTVGADWGEFRLSLPEPLPAGPPVLRLDVPPFRPINEVAGSRDPRDLGVMVDRIRILAARERAAVNVLMLTSSYPKFPGDVTAPFIESIAHAVAARGHLVDVVLPHHPELRRPRDEPVRFFPYRYAPRETWSLWGYAQSLVADVRVRRAAFLLAPLAALALRARVGERLRARRYDLVHAHWLVPNAALVTDMLAAHAVPLVVSLHGSDVFLAERLAPARALARAALAAAGAVTACSGDLHRRALALGARPERTRTVPYGVDTTAFKPGADSGMRRTLGVADDAFLVLAFGRLVEKKGFADLIDAAARVPALHVVIAGEGDLRSQLEAQARAVHAPVSLLGNLERPALAKALAAADAVAVPSVVDRAGNLDGLPNALLEALAAGRPVVATRVGGIPDVVEDGVNGLLVPSGDPAALAAALERLAREPETCARLAAAARASAETRLTWSAAAQAFEECYAQAAALAAR